MTQFPSQPRPHMSTFTIRTGTQTRMRWDNIAMLGAGVAVVLGMAATLMSFSHHPSSTQQMQAQVPVTMAPANTPATAATSPATAADSSTSAATQSDGSSYVTDPVDAKSLVDDARDFITQGRWAEAADRLNTVTPTLRASSGADDVRAELTAAQTKWTGLDRNLRSDVAALNWSAAKSDLARLAALAPLDDDELALRDQVQQATAPVAARPAAAATTTATPAVTKPAAVATASPATAAAKPAVSATTTAATSAVSSLLGGGAGGGALPAASSAQLTTALKLLGNIAGS